MQNLTHLFLMATSQCRSQWFLKTVLDLKETGDEMREGMKRRLVPEIAGIKAS